MTKHEYEFWVYQIVIFAVGYILWTADWSIMLRYAKFLMGV